MDKEEILKKSRIENRDGDERDHQVKDRSMMWAYIFMVVVSAAFRLFDTDAPIMDFSAAIASSACAAMTYRFIKTKSILYLIMALVMLGLTVLSTVRFFMGH